LTLYEGEAATLWSSKNLAIADEDNLDEVRVRIVSGLAHGRLLKEASSVKEFVAADLQTGILRYQHDGSDTTADSLVLQMNDGQHQVEFLLPIIIIPVDDEPPVLLANTGILLQIANHTVPITSKILRAKDFDSNDEAIRYTLNSSIPWGSFFLINGESQLEVQSWTESDIVQGRNFFFFLKLKKRNFKKKRRFKYKK
jgi:FRAS1-related extracelluar matrix protein 1/2